MEVVKALGVEDLEKHYQEKVALINETLAPYEKINKIIAIPKLPHIPYKKFKT